MKFEGHTDEGKAYADWAKIQQAAAMYERFVVEVRRYNKQREISLAQMAYFHAVVVPALTDHIGCSPLMAELILKKKCGEDFFVKVVDGEKILISKTMLTTKQMTAWLENIWDWMDSIGCPVPPPDREWREKS